MTFAEFLSGKPEELKEANDQLNKSHDDLWQRSNRCSTRSVRRLKRATSAI
jgi:hypothetical protein